jgi:hypothetical protein
MSRIGAPPSTAPGSVPPGAVVPTVPTVPTPAIPTVAVATPGVAPLPSAAVTAAQSAAVTQAALPITQSLSDKITSGLILGANTGLTTVAPALGTVIPGANPTGAGGWEVAALGNGVLTFVQAFQTIQIRRGKGRQHRTIWSFDRDRWGPWIIIVLGLAVCWFLWVWVPSVTGEPVSAATIQKGVLNGFGTIYNAFQAFGPWSKLGVMSGQIRPETAVGG